MERSVLCIASQANNQHLVRAIHTESLEEGLLIRIFFWARADIANWDIGGVAVSLRIGHEFSIYSYGNLISKSAASWEEKRMRWLKKPIPLVNPISINKKVITFFAEGRGALLPNMPPLNVERIRFLRLPKKDQATHPMVAEDVHLPRRLVVRIEELAQ